VEARVVEVVEVMVAETVAPGAGAVATGPVTPALVIVAPAARGLGHAGIHRQVRVREVRNARDRGGRGGRE